MRPARPTSQLPNPPPGRDSVLTVILAVVVATMALIVVLDLLWD